MKLVFEVPILLSTEIGVKAKEVEELFQIYHKISEHEVTEIFKSFPYLYCCPSTKLQAFLAQFRKYRLSKEQILNLVRIIYPPLFELLNNSSFRFCSARTAEGCLGVSPKLSLVSSTT